MPNEDAEVSLPMTFQALSRNHFRHSNTFKIRPTLDVGSSQYFKSENQAKTYQNEAAYFEI